MRSVELTRRRSRTTLSLSRNRRRSAENPGVGVDKGGRKEPGGKGEARCPRTSLQTAETLTTALTCQLALLSTYYPLSCGVRTCMCVCTCVCVRACMLGKTRCTWARASMRGPPGTVSLSNVCELSRELYPLNGGSLESNLIMGPKYFRTW